jgi:hypothetical protein
MENFMKKLFLLICIVGSAVCANAGTHADAISTLKSMAMKACLKYDLSFLPQYKLENIVRRTVEYGTLKELKELFEKGADPNMPIMKRCHGQTPLMMVVISGLEDKVRVLLESKADPDFFDTYDDPPLVLAAEYGRIPIAKMLLEAKANPNISKRRFHWTPLRAAAYLRRGGGMAALLLASGADCMLQDEQFMSALNYARARYNNNCATLMVTCFDFFCASPADFLARTKAAWESEGRNGLTFEMMHGGQIHQPLLDNLFPELKQVQSFDDMCALYLRYCVQMGNVSLVRLLLNSGVNIENPLAKKNFLIMYAVDSQDKPTVDLLKLYCSDWLRCAAYVKAKNSAHFQVADRMDRRKYAAKYSMHLIHGSLLPSLKNMAAIACLEYEHQSSDFHFDMDDEG